MASKPTMQFHTIAAVAKILSLSPRTVRRLIAKGELVAHRFGTSVRIADDDLRAYAGRHREA